MPGDVDSLSDDADEGLNARPDVGALSDDDAQAAGSSTSTVRKRVREKPSLTGDEISAQSKQLHAIVQSKCKCADSSCREVFRHDRAKTRLVLQQRIELLELPKMDADKQAS